MTRIPVQSPAGAYDICIGEGLLNHAGALLRNRGMAPGAAAIVTNDMLTEPYAAALSANLAAAGFEAFVCTVPEGEQHKSLATVANLYPQFLAGGLDRKSPVISLGGGVVGDMAGFAAAPDANGVMVSWQTASELQMVGFNVLRSSLDSTRKGGSAEWVTVNEALIFAEFSGAANGAVYTFVDAGVEAGFYSYVLEIVRPDGSAERYGLAQVTVE